MSKEKSTKQEAVEQPTAEQSMGEEELDKLKLQQATMKTPKKATKKVESKPLEKESSKPLPEVDEKYQSLANLNYMTDAKAQREVIDIINEVEKIDGVSLRKSSDHDLTILFEGRTLVRICPLKKSYSASLNGGKIENHSKDEIIKAITKGISERKEEIAKVTARIQKEQADAKEKEARTTKKK